MSKEAKALYARSRTTKAKVEGLALRAAETSQLIGICVERIDSCGKVTGRIDPVVGSIVRYVRNEATSAVLEIGS